MQGTGTDPRSDVYSLGATLHHLSTGATPPDALTRAAALVNGDEDPLRPASEVHAQVTPAVGAVLARAMSQSAARRFASAAEMRDALREAGRDVPAASDLQSAPPALAATLISEQETRLLHEAGTARGAGRETEKETNVNRRPDAPALTDAAHAAPRTAHAAPRDPTRVPGTEPVKTSVPDNDSVVTSVRADSAATSGGAHATRAAAKGGQSLRAVGVGVAAGLVVLALVAVYAFTRRAAPPATVEQPPARIATPPTDTQPAATVESQPQTVAEPSPTPSPVAAQPTPRRSGAGVAAVTTRGAATANANRASRGTNVVGGDPDVPEPPDPDEEALRELQSINTNNAAGLTPQQVEAIRQRAAVLRRRAIQQRRLNERQRRRRRLAPLPPPTP